MKLTPFRKCSLLQLQQIQGTFESANEPSSSESHIVQKILEINELMKKCSYLSDKELRNSTESSSLNQENNLTRNLIGQNNCKGERLEDGEQEIHCQLTSKSYSCLRTKMISSSTTVLKIHSKTTLNKVESGNSKSSETEISMEKVSTPSKRSLHEKNQTFHENTETEDKLGNLASRKGERWTSSSSKDDGNKIPLEETHNMEDKSMGDTLLNCPFELIEIYSSRRARSADNKCRKGSVGTTKETSTTRTIPEQDNDTNNNFHENILGNNFAEPTQHRKCASRSSKLDVDVINSNGTFIITSEKDEGNSSANFVTAFTEMDKGCVKEKLNIMNGKNDLEEIGGSRNSQNCNKDEASVECSKKDNPSVCKDDVKALYSQNSNAEENNNSNISGNTDLLKRSTWINDIPMKKEKEGLVGKGEIIKKEDREEVLHTIEERDLTKQCDGNTKSANVISRGTIVSKISLESDATVVVKGSKSDSLSMENATDLKDGDLSFTRQNTHGKSGNEPNIKVIIGKRKNKKNCTSKECSESTRSSTTIHKRERDQDSCKIQTRTEIEGPKYGISIQEQRRINVNYEAINICKTLTKIYGRLSCDWQRIDRLRMKLQKAPLIESGDSVNMLQLLDKTIARCKSYIHGASDSCQAESKITKLLSKYILELVKIVNESKITLENQERRVDQMLLETSQGQHAARKRSILNELTLIANYWMNNISCLIEVISRLVKNVMTENEEKENVKSPQIYKIMQRRTPNNIPVNDTKQKLEINRPKNAKVNLSKQQSTIDSQMSVVSNSINPLKQHKSKTSVKYPLRNPEKDKRQDNIQTNVVDKKATDSCRHLERAKPAKKLIPNTNFNQCKQSIPRPKHRTPNNLLPAWRPGGAVQIPSSSSVSVLNPKLRSCIHTREKAYFEHAKTSTNKRGNSMDHIVTKKNPMYSEKIPEDSGKRVARVYNTMKEKQGRATSDLSKQSSTDVCLKKDIVTILDIDDFKTTAKRSSISLKNSPRLNVLKLPTKNRIESLHHSPDHTYTKSYEGSSSFDVIDQTISNESRVFRELEEVIKGLTDKEGGRGKNNSILCYQFHSDNFVPFEKSDESPLIEEEMKLNEEEPTRDVDSKQYKENQLKNDEGFQKEHKLIEKLLEKPVFGDIENVGISENLENSQSKRHFSFASMPSSNCPMNFHSSSDCLLKPELLKSCEISLNSLSPSDGLRKELKEEKQRGNDASKAYSIDCSEKNEKNDGKNASMLSNPSKCKKEVKNVNCHAASLSMLKEFLCDQGINVDLVNRAERYLKDKQIIRKSLQKKSISFADVSSSVGHNKQLVSTSKNQLNLQEKFGQNIDTCIQNYKNNRHDLNKIPLLEKEDSATSTFKNSNNAYSQTLTHCKMSKSLQTIPENDSLMVNLNLQSIQTMTKVGEVKHVACECSNKDLNTRRANVSSMTESPPINDSPTKIENIPRATKSVFIDHTNNSNKNLKEKFYKNSNNISVKHNFKENLKLKPPLKLNQASKSMDIRFTNKAIEDYKSSSKECSTLFRQLLNQMYDKCNESSMNFTNIDKENALPSVKSDVSLSSNFTTSSLNSLGSCRCSENATEKETHSPLRVISSEMVAAFQEAAIRARNVYRAIDIYKRKLRNKFRKLGNRSKCRRRTDKVFTTFKKQLHSVPKANSGVKIIMQKRNSYKSGVIEMSQILRQEEEVTVAFSKTSFDLHNESEDETFKSTGTSSRISTVEINFGKNEVEVPNKSASSVVLGDVSSVMKFLVNETENLAFEQIQYIQTISNSNICSKFVGNMKVKDEKISRWLSLFCRENLLPVVYGIVCCIVFWCLQFTISCEVVS